MSSSPDQSPMLPRPTSPDGQVTGLEPMLPTTIPSVSLPWLDPERARSDPWRAFELAGAWLPQDLLEELARVEPIAALKFVSARLPKPLLGELALLEARAAVGCAGYLMTQEEWARHAISYVYDVYTSATEPLTSEDDAHFSR